MWTISKLKGKSDWSLWIYNQLLILLCLMGLSLSLYSYQIEIKIQQNKNYKPFCDITDDISCTKTITSRYGKGFGIFDEDSILYKPNSFFGIVFYSMLGTLCLSNSTLAVRASLILIVLSSFASLYFAYILYFILVDLCIICIGIYLVNTFNLVIITKKYKRIRLLNEQRQIENLKKSN